MEIVSEYEELLKLKEFGDVYENNPNEFVRQSYWNTYYMICDAMIDEYREDINNKLKRWSNVTKYQYLKSELCVKYYFECKLLYRDGFYESVIVMARSISEMICYAILKAQNSPFQSVYNEKRLLFKVIMFPRQITGEEFQKNKENYLIKSIYSKTNKVIKLKCKEKVCDILKNTDKEIFCDNMRRLDKNNFFSLGKLSYSNYEILNKVYDKANEYVHKGKVTKSDSELENDAKDLLNKIGQVLYDIYGVSEIKEGMTICSGYTNFKSICKGNNYMLTFYNNIDDVIRGEKNLPSKEQFDNLCSLQGDWSIKWKTEGVLNSADIQFIIGEDKGVYSYIEHKGKKNHMEIQLYDDKIVLKEFDEITHKHDNSIHSLFKLTIIDDSTLVGETSRYEYAYANRKG